MKKIITTFTCIFFSAAFYTACYDGSGSSGDDQVIVPPTETTGEGIVDIKPVADGAFEPPALLQNRIAYVIDPIAVKTVEGVYESKEIVIPVKWFDVKAVQINGELIGTSGTNGRLNTIEYMFMSIDDEGLESLEKYYKMEFASNNITGERGEEIFHFLRKLNFPIYTKNISKIKIRLTSGDWRAELRSAEIQPLSAAVSIEEESTDQRSIMVMKAVCDDPSVFAGEITNSDKITYTVKAAAYNVNTNGQLTPCDVVNLQLSALSLPAGSTIDGDKVTIALPKFGSTNIVIGGLCMANGMPLASSTSFRVWKNSPPVIKALISPATTMINWGSQNEVIIAEFEIVDPERAMGQKISYSLQIPSFAVATEILDVDGSRIGITVRAKGLITCKSGIKLEVTDGMSTTVQSYNFVIESPRFNVSRISSPVVTFWKKSGGDFPVYCASYYIKIYFTGNSVTNEMLAYMKNSIGMVEGNVQATRTTGVGVPMTSISLEHGEICAVFEKYNDEFVVYKNSSSGSSQMSFNLNYGGQQVYSNKFNLSERSVLRWGR